MDLLRLFGRLFQAFGRSRFRTADLTWLLRQFRRAAPELDSDTVLLAAAQLYLQPYIDRSRLSLLDLAVAYKVGRLGYCGLTLSDMQQHDTQPNPDEAGRLTRWIMQIEFLRVNADLNSAQPEAIANLLIESKPAIERDIRAALNGLLPKRSTRTRYTDQIERFRHSPTYEADIQAIRYAMDQV